MCSDVCENMAFGVITLDFRNSSGKTPKRKEAFESTIMNFKDQTSDHKTRRKKVNGKKVDYFEGIGDDQLRTTVNFYWENEIAYCFFTTDYLWLDNTAAIERFFNSIIIGEPLPIPEYSGKYSDARGAFAINFPIQPEMMIQEVNETELNTEEPFKVYIHYATDLNTNSGYYLFYNDYPTGYYMDNTDYFFESMEEQLATVYDIIDQEERTVDGANAKLYKIIFEKQFYAEILVFARGNRIYKLMSQNLRPNEKNISIEGDHFLESFTFLDYETPKIGSFYSEHLDRELIKFSTTYENIDNEIVFNIPYGEGYHYSTTNGASGGLFAYYETELNEYFHTDHIDSFLSDYKTDLIGWKDSVLVDTILRIDGNSVLHLELAQNKFDQLQKFECWLDGGYIKLLSMFASKNEANTKSDKLFFDYFDKSNGGLVDYSISKKESIFENLQSSDSITFEKALGSFSYYDYKLTDLPFLHQELSTKFQNDSISGLVHQRILNVIGNFEDKSSVTALSEIYKNQKTSEITKDKILTSLVYFDEEDYIEQYLDLIINYPKKDQQLNWVQLKPFRDSSELVKKHFDYVLKLIENAENDEYILDILSQHVEDGDNELLKLIDGNFKAITINAFPELTKLESKFKENKNNYYWNYGNQFSILDLLKTIKKPEFAKEFTNQFYSIDTTQYARTSIIATQIINNIDYDKKFTSELLDSIETQKDIVDAFIDSDRWDEIPITLNSPVQYSKLAVHEYLYDDDSEYYDELKSVGTIQQENREYHAYLSIYSYDDEVYSNLHLVGPFEIGKQKFDRKSLMSLAKYEVEEANWKEAGLELLKNIEEE